MSTEQPVYYTRAEGARALRMSQRTFDTHLSTGRIAHIKIGRRVLVTKDALLNIGDRHTREALGG
ncbi:MAG TPA: helix-turn-helix domain-containing protein [Acidobacteriaceae bacterium]|nr:helix-turn-helix domain-containing protein [Acidobacteriaceae bacterium]